MRSKAAGAPPRAHVRRRGGVQEPAPCEPPQDAELHRAGQGFRVSHVESGGLVEPDTALDIARDHAIKGQHVVVVVRSSEGNGHADPRCPLEAHLAGLLLPGERRNVEPMAPQIDPRQVRWAHPSMYHYGAKAPWDDQAVLAVARDWVLTQLERHAPIGAWVA